MGVKPCCKVIILRGSNRIDDLKLHVSCNRNPDELYWPLGTGKELSNTFRTSYGRGETDNLEVVFSDKSKPF